MRTLRGRRAALLLASSVLVVGSTLLATPSPLRAVAGSDDAVAYRIDAGHTGSQPTDTLTPPLAGRWSVDLGGAVSFPLIAGGRVFVTVADPSGTGSSLYALDPAGGTTLWKSANLGGPYTFSAAAYDGGRVFVVNGSGLLQAFDAATGAVAWSATLPGQYSFTSPPTASNGVVYTGGAGSGGTVYAVSESTGALLWTAPVQNGDASSPAVSQAGVYVTYACQQDYAFDPLQGTQLWHHSTGCEGGGGATPALAGGRLYDLNSGYVNGAWTGPVVLDAASGAEVGSFTADRGPAVDGGTGFLMSGGTLRAVTLATGAVTWSFAGDGTLTTAPVVAHGEVYVAGTSGMLYALDEAGGAVTWSQNLGAAVPAPINCACQVAGLAVGEGMLLAPAGTKLVALTTLPAPVVSGVAPAGGPTTGGVSVSVTGSGFSHGVSAVRFGGATAGGVTVVSDTRLTAISPPEAAGVVDVTVTGPGGTSATSAADRYTVVAPPVVSTVCPSFGPTRGGTAVTLTGSGLTGATGVRFGSTAAASFSVVSDTSVRAVTPAAPAGTVTVSVTTALGGVGSGPATYTFATKPKTGGC